ncbi:MAG: 6-phosphogluconolactonase [Nevskia sp.]|nr:6-phosphogluconolactonase [Nevskia sp.]
MSPSAVLPPTPQPEYPVEFDLPDPASLAAALARSVATDLQEAVRLRGAALLAVSGGNTPRAFLRTLSNEYLDWSKLTVTLTDERWVAPDDARSNAALVREHLLQGAAAAARFVPLYAQAADPESGLAEVAARLGALSLPFDALVLGMGLDGHCASLFPGGDHLEAALRYDTREQVLPMRAPAAPEPRITLTLPALVNTRRLYLHIEGLAKREILQLALGPGGESLPIGALLRRATEAAHLYWCP